MTALGGREVDANLLRGAAPGSAQPPADAHNAGRQDLGDLVQALARGHQVGVESVAGRTVALSQLTMPGWGAYILSTPEPSRFYHRVLTALLCSTRWFGTDSLVA
jgi:hypothetical protein